MDDGAESPNVTKILVTAARASGAAANSPTRPSKGGILKLRAVSEVDCPRELCRPTPALSLHRPGHSGDYMLTMGASDPGSKFRYTRSWMADQRPGFWVSLGSATLNLGKSCGLLFQGDFASVNEVKTTLRLKTRPQADRFPEP